jgi:Fe-S-cluster containining protein
MAVTAAEVRAYASRATRGNAPDSENEVRMNDADPTAGAPATSLEAPLPGLRAGVEVEVSGETGALFDATFGRRIKLDPRGLVLAQALADATADRRPSALAALAQTEAKTVVTLTDRLSALDLLDTPRARARAKDRVSLAAVRATPAAHLRPIPGRRFGCTMCGSCCGGHNIGPVSDAILDGLDAHLDALEPAIRAARRIDKDLFFVLPGDRATPGRDVMCQASGGSCVFLDERGLCRIHAKVGGDAKPLPCRIFPWELVLTPTGVRVAVQRECRDFLAATADDRPQVRDAEAELVALVQQIPELPVARLAPRLRGQELASWADVEALEADLRAALAAPHPAPSSMSIESSQLHPSMPIEASPDATSSLATFAALAAALPPASGDAPAADFDAWRARLSTHAKAILAAAPAPDARVSIRVDALRLLVAALDAADGWTLARALAPVEGELVRLLSAHLDHALWSTTPLRATSIEGGLGRVHAEWLLARLMGIVRAREVKRFHVTTQDVQDGLANASFLFRHADLGPVLGELDPLTAATFLDGCTGALAAAPDRTLDRRTELVKF